eukprot:TRINITY_DN78932_c0_g1_i1.p1 TRINITY_DN78932_c0_g1~~TRINITY_DN78932_c0_g1_i1.p1  ORF type:complete len:400 (+),score=39.15 TRINITY_DN78932_c0_g1_i1:59-1258(+)
MSAGLEGSVFLRGDGLVLLSCGYQGLPVPVDPPELPVGESYLQVATSSHFAVLLRSDGAVVTWMPRDDPDDSPAGYGNCEVPALPGELSYEQVGAGSFHLVLLRSDGQVLIGNDDCNSGQEHTELVPPLPEGLVYTQVSGGYYVTALLRSDGEAFFLDHRNGKVTTYPISELPHGVTYTQVAAGCECHLLLRSDGRATIIGQNHWGECDVPELPPGVVYTQISRGHGKRTSRGLTVHNALLRSDGQVVAIGSNLWGQCVIPSLPEGVTYADVSVGADHTLLHRSDGEVIAVGCKDKGQCDVPALPAGMRYMSCHRAARVMVQLTVSEKGAKEDCLQISCSKLSGEVIFTIDMSPSQLGLELHTKVNSVLGRDEIAQVVLPSGGTLRSSDFDTPLNELLI